MLAPGILAILGVILAIAAYALVTDAYTSWGMVNYLLLLVPSLYIIPGIAEVYENERAGYIFTSITPKHVIMRQRFVYGMTVSFVLMGVLFSLAYLGQLEVDIWRIFTLFIPSMFIALVGLTAANLTKKRMPGYLAALALWIVPLIGGMKLSEQIWFIAPYLPLNTYSMVLWESLWTMTVIGVVLYIINIFMVSRREVDRIEASVSILICAVIAVLAAIPLTNPDNRYFTKDNGLHEANYNSKALYCDARLPESVALEAAKKLDFMARQLAPYFDELDSVQTYYIVREGTETGDSGTALTYEHRYISELNPSKFTPERPDLLVITNSILSRYNLYNRPEYFREGLANYLLYAVAAAQLDEISTPEYRSRYYVDFLTPQASADYRERLEGETYPSSYFAYILMKTEERYGTQTINSILKAVGDLADGASIEAVEQVFLDCTSNGRNIAGYFTRLKQLTEDSDPQEVL